MVKFKDLFRFKRNEVQASFKNATVANKIYGLKLLKTPIKDIPEGLDHGKLLIIIPRTVGKATIRNLLRRQIKSIFFENKLYKEPSISILLVYKNAANLSFEQIKNFLVSSFEIKKGLRSSIGVEDDTI